MALHLPERRAEDSLFSFQARQVVLGTGGRRFVIEPVDARFLLVELAKIEGTRAKAARSASTIVSVALSQGWPVAFAEDEERALVRALEGLRARRPLSPGLRALRDELVAAR
ncbi:MAG TPA: hypothetical protein VLJ76_10660 [Gaiellaceae bacterium]|nr:hypothetical protein [Gaiellaceae bacterium]